MMTHTTRNRDKAQFKKLFFMMALCAAAAATTTEAIAEKEQRLRKVQAEYELQIVAFKQEKLQEEIREYRSEQEKKRALPDQSNAVALDTLSEITSIQAVCKKLKGQRVGVEWAKGQTYYGQIVGAKVQVKYDDNEVHWESDNLGYETTCARSPFCTKHNKHTGRCNQLGAAKEDTKQTSNTDYKPRTSVRVKQYPIFLGVGDGLFDTVARDWKSY